MGEDKGGRTREHRLKRTIYPLAVKGQICPGSGRLADEHFGGKRG